MFLTAVSDIASKGSAQSEGSLHTFEGYDPLWKCELSGKMWMVKAVEKSTSENGYTGVCAQVGFFCKLSVKKFCEQCNTEGKAEQEHQSSS